MTDGSRDVLLQGVADGRMLHGRSCDILTPSLCTNLLLGLWTSVFRSTGIYVFFASWLAWNICISSVSSDITPIICYRESLERAHKGRLSNVPEDTCLLACGSWRHLGVLAIPCWIAPKLSWVGFWEKGGGDWWQQAICCSPQQHEKLPFSLRGP